MHAAPTRGQLLLLSLSSRCGYYSGYRCGFYSNIYGSLFRRSKLCTIPPGNKLWSLLAKQFNLEYFPLFLHPPPLKFGIRCLLSSVRSKSWHVQYRQNCWQELNLAAGPQFTIVKILADLNLAVQKGIAIHIVQPCSYMKYWQILIWQLQRQTTKPPNLLPRQIFRLYSMLQ